VVVSVVVSAWRHPRLGRLLGCVAALAVAPLALNPGYAGLALRTVAQRSTPVPNVLAHFYPWAYTSEGLGRLWLGDWAAISAGARAFGAYAFTLTALGFAGLVVACLVRLRGGSRRCLAFACTVLALAVVPLLVLTQGWSFPYQFYKLLCTVSPLLFLGLCLLGQPVTAAPRRGWLAWLAVPPLAVVFVLAAASTAWMAWDSSRTAPHGRCFGHYLCATDLRDLQRLLPRLPHTNLVLALDHPPCPHHPPAALNSWLSYFGRRHRLWVAAPTFIDVEAWQDVAAGLADFSDLPPDILVLTARCLGVQTVDRGRARPVWSGVHFTLLHCPDGAWAVPLAFSNPNGCEGTLLHSWSWMGTDRVTLDVLAGRPGTVTLSGTFGLGPSLPASDCTVRVRCAGYQGAFFTRGGPGALEVPVPAGRSRITLEVLDRPVLRSFPNQGPRALLLLVTDLSFRYRPGLNASSPR
jgi:hypothetical protein